MNIIAIGRPTHLAVNRSTACGLVGAVFSKTDDPRKVDCLRCRRTRIARAMLAFEAVNAARGFREYPTKQTRKNQHKMKCSAQPTLSVPRQHQLTVRDVLEALSEMPPDARIAFRCGGKLEAAFGTAYLEPKFEPETNTVRTVWE